MSPEFQNPETVGKILRDYSTIAVVGISDKPDRPSNRVARYLQMQGYKIIPVNPRVEEVLGEKAYPDLGSIPVPVDVVDIFRKSEEVMPIVEDAIAGGAKAVWMQESVINEAAARKAADSGLDVVMDMCMLKEHQRHAV